MNIDQTTITTVAAILSSKELLQKILGPSADYIGGEIKNLGLSVIWRPKIVSIPYGYWL